MKHCLSLRRWFYRRRVSQQTVGDWLAAPLPAKNLEARKAGYLVVDLEMTGLDSRQDKILSIGWVNIDKAAISIASAEHLYIKRNDSVGESAVIHQIRDADLYQGVSEAEALAKLMIASCGRVVVFHSASLDLAFLNRACVANFSAPFVTAVVDTMRLEQQAFARANTPIQSGELRLAACRLRHHLPFYPGHNALIDAVATAELFLAILARKGNCPLGAVLA